MSFLTLPGGPPGGAGLRIATINVWFWCPEESAQAARREFAPYRDLTKDIGPPPPMCGIVPVMQWGPHNVKRMKKVGVTDGSVDISGQNWHWHGSPLCEWQVFETYSFTGTLSNLMPELTADLHDPSFIGIDCRTDKTRLTFNFQYAPGTVPERADGFDFKQTSGDRPFYDNYTPFLLPATGCNPDLVYDDTGAHAAPSVGGLYTTTDTYASDDRFIKAVPPRFGTFPRDGGRVLIGLGNGINIEDDNDWYAGAGVEIELRHWHCLTMSFSLRDVASKGRIGGPQAGTGSYSAASLLYMALDDRNLTKRELSYFWIKNNDVLTEDGWYTYRRWAPPSGSNFVEDNAQGHSVNQVTSGYTKPDYLFKSAVLPFGDTIFLPGNASSTKHIVLADMDIYNNLLIDTFKKENRRLFVTDKGKPTSPGKRDKDLGMKPIRRLRYRSRWKKADDTGTMDLDGFATGKIQSYVPDPNLYGEQE